MLIEIVSSKTGTVGDFGIIWSKQETVRQKLLFKIVFGVLLCLHYF